jgi:hypothetical protein
MLELNIFRRWESSQLNPEIIADRCPGFSIDSPATNQSWSMELSGLLFESKFLEIPMLHPGESLTIPIVLDHAVWELPPGFDWLQIPQTMRGYSDVGTEGDIQLGQIQQQAEILNLDAWWMWNVLYYGSTVDFNVISPLMADVIDGQYTPFTCFTGVGNLSQVNPQQ